MLWIALNFPRLPLESFPPTSSNAESWAVSEGSSVMVCSEKAAAQGIRPGMSLAAACAMTPDFRYRQRNAAAEAAALEQLATWAGQFTPAVSLQPPGGLVLEIEGSLRMFKGIGNIIGKIKRDTAEMGYTVSLACAPTVTAAWLLARGGAERVFAGQRAIREAISPLPVQVLDCDTRTLDTLTAIGARTIGDLLGLPRDGAAKRFGQKLLDQLDRALGARPEARMFFAMPPRFDAALEFEFGITNTETLLFPAKRLLTQLAGYLASRCAGVQQFRLLLRHEDTEAETVIEIGLSAPARDAERFTLLVREKLATVALDAPITRVRIEASEVLRLAGESADLFPRPTCDPGDWGRLLERLRARLGADAVHGLTPSFDHRPERAWQAAAPGTKAKEIKRPPRPLWLLEEPRPLSMLESRPQYRNQSLALTAGPERIESGWWDGGDVKRDYFIAQTPDLATVWVYRERKRPGGWYLHGIFG